jgi:uncharacterized iron-regulated membrane protein
LIELEERSVAHSDHPQSGVIKREGAHLYGKARRALFWCHFVVGLAIGLIVTFLAITGSIMSFQDRVITFAEGRVQVQPAREAPCISVEPGLEAVRAQTAQTAATVQVFADGARPSLMTLPQGETFLVDACGGHVLSPGSRWRKFFEDDENLHRWLALSRGKHETLRACKNAAVVAFLFLVLSGLVLWLPRRWRAANLRAALMLRRGLKGKAWLWALHQVSGFWMASQLVILIVTGLMMAYPWTMQAALRLVRSDEPIVAKSHDVRLPVGSFAGIDALLQRAAVKDPHWKSISFALPEEKEKNVAFTIDEGAGNRPSERGTLLLARRDGREVRWAPFLIQSRAQRWRSEVKYLHTGEIFGLVGQIVVLLAVMAALVQVATGFGMAWKRWRGRQDRQARIAHVQAKSGFSAPGNLRRAGRQAREETYGGR